MEEDQIRYILKNLKHKLLHDELHTRSDLNKFFRNNNLDSYITNIKYDLYKLMKLGKIMREYLDENNLLWIGEYIHENIDQVSSWIFTDNNYFYKKE